MQCFHRARDAFHNLYLPAYNTSGQVSRSHFRQSAQALSVATTATKVQQQQLQTFSNIMLTFANPLSSVSIAHSHHQKASSLLQQLAALSPTLPVASQPVQHPASIRSASIGNSHRPPYSFHMPASQLTPATGRGRHLHCTSGHCASAGASSPVATLLRHVSFRSLSTSKVLSDKQKQGPDISQLSTDMQRLWNHAENTHLDHVVVTACSRRKVHWLCNKCPDGVPHKWQAPVTNVWRSHRKHRNGCPYCASKAVCSHNSLVRHAPHLVKEWDDAKNPYMPQDYTVSASYNAHWKCDQGHEWQTSIGNRVQRRTGCPECARISPRQKLPSLEANAENILQGWDWERNNQEGIDHRQLTCGSRKKAHFKCPSGHTWLAQIRDIFRNKGTGCPDCNRQRSATS